jgi:quercetin dioxygenase-like cupin family protein
MMSRNCLLGLSLCLPLLLSGAALADPAPAEVKQLMTKELIGAAGKEILMSTVTYPPGGASPSHRHDAQVLVYVLEGELIMQVQCGVRKCESDSAGEIFSVHHQGQGFANDPPGQPMTP